jgi:hypothetical protein
MRWPSNTLKRSSITGSCSRSTVIFRMCPASHPLQLGKVPSGQQ